MTGVKNCHCRGVDSIVLRESPMVRVFITRPDHALWQNTLPHIFSVGFHPHATNIEIEVIHGQISNVEPGFVHKPDKPSLLMPGKIKDLAQIDSLLDRSNFRRYRFDSFLRGGLGGFQDMDVVFHVSHFNRKLETGAKLSLHGRHLHTIHVEKGQEVAWVIREGAANPNFEPICWSNAPLTEWTADGLYIPMTTTELKAAQEKYQLDAIRRD